VRLPIRARALLCRLVDRVQNAKIMFGILEIAFCHHPVARAGRIPPQLQVFLEQLLRSAANPQIRAAAVKDMVPVQRDVAAILPGASAAATAAATAPVGTSAHAFHVHPIT
jgi:hypothetical protein